MRGRTRTAPRPARPARARRGPARQAVVGWRASSGTGPGPALLGLRPRGRLVFAHASAGLGLATCGGYGRRSSRSASGSRECGLGCACAWRVGHGSCVCPRRDLERGFRWRCPDCAFPVPARGPASFGAGVQRPAARTPPPVVFDRPDTGLSMRGTGGVGASMGDGRSPAAAPGAGRKRLDGNSARGVARCRCDGPGAGIGRRAEPAGPSGPYGASNGPLGWARRQTCDCSSPSS
jgi:hypothetical protein